MPAKAVDHFTGMLSAHPELSNPDVHSVVGIITASAIEAATIVIGMTYTGQPGGEVRSLILTLVA